MGSVQPQLFADLRARLGLGHAVETGTYLGGGTRLLAEIFERVTTIEWSRELHAQARRTHADLDNAVFLQGHSAEVLPQAVREDMPGLYFLDGHWSGDITAGAEDECPVLAEIAALREGHADDCIVIDDARLFTAAPPPPHDPAQWPTLLEIIDALRAIHPTAHITVLDDQIISVPPRARATVDAFGQSL